MRQREGLEALMPPSPASSLGGGGAAVAGAVQGKGAAGGRPGLWAGLQESAE